MTPREVIEFAKKNKVAIVDLKFIDLPGLWQHVSMSAAELSEDLFENGHGFDGSSIRGFQAINESDMLLFPDPLGILENIAKLYGESSIDYIHTSTDVESEIYL